MGAVATEEDLDKIAAKINELENVDPVSLFRVCVNCLNAATAGTGEMSK